MSTESSQLLPRALAALGDIGRVSQLPSVKQKVQAILRKHYEDTEGEESVSEADPFGTYKDNEAVAEGLARLMPDIGHLRDDVRAHLLLPAGSWR